MIYIFYPSLLVLYKSFILFYLFQSSLADGILWRPVLLGSTTFGPVISAAPHFLRFFSTCFGAQTSESPKRCEFKLLLGPKQIIYEKISYKKHGNVHIPLYINCNKGKREVRVRSSSVVPKWNIELISLCNVWVLQMPIVQNVTLGD